MAIIYKVLGQAVTSGSFVGNALYTAPVGGTAVSSTLSVCNLNSADSSYSIAVVPTGQTIGAKHSIASNSVIKGNETIALSMGITLGSNDSIIVNSINSNLSFNLFGSQSMITDVLVNYLVVAGGGGGGCFAGGGAGAGGMLTGQTLLLTGEVTYGITVGSGGAGSSTVTLKGSNGAISSFSTITATGGGGGGSDQSKSGANGGSGGGTGINGGTAGTGIAGQGNSGFTGDGGGGGGAGAAGQSLAGGIGLLSNITGISTYYAGGGAGWGRDSLELGGLGGGGNGGWVSGSYNGSNGTPNTGGGGGGAGNNTGTNGIGGTGGSGIVILKVPTKYTAAFSGGLTSSVSMAVAGYKIYSVTAGTGTVSISYNQ